MLSTTVRLGNVLSRAVFVQLHIYHNVIPILDTLSTETTEVSKVYGVTAQYSLSSGSIHVHNSYYT